MDLGKNIDKYIAIVLRGSNWANFQVFSFFGFY